MPKVVQRCMSMGLKCCGQARVKHEEEEVPTAGLKDSSSIYAPDPTLSTAIMPSKVAAVSSHTTHITVRTFTDSSGGASSLSGVDEQQEHQQQQQLARPGSIAWQDSASSCEKWYDCAEDWQEDATLAAGATNDTQQQQAAEELLAGLPAELARILRRYTEGRSLGCKPAVALMQYMEASGTSLEQLQQQLEPLLAAEQQDHADALDLPVPTSAMDPEARTAALVDAASQAKQQNDHASSNNSSSQLQRGRPSLSRLLGNVKLCSETLAGMRRVEGFKQVAWGQLELWYCHDTAHHRQIIRGRVVLDEPVEHVVCLAREIDLATSWNLAITEMLELAAYSPSELLLYLLLWTPWPLPQPEVVNYAVGLDLLDSREEAVLIATHGCSGDLPAGVTLPQHGRAQRLVMDAGGFKFRPLPPHPYRPDVQRMEATVLVSIDASRWVVPDALISFVLKVFAPLVLKSVLKVLQRMFHSSSKAKASSADGAACSGSTLMHRLAARPEYAAIGAHARRYLAAKAAAQAGSGNDVQQ